MRKLPLEHAQPDPVVVWYKQVTPLQMFSDYCLMILQIIIAEHLWGTSCACIKRPQDHSYACPRCDFLTNRSVILSARSWDSNHWTSVMESSVCIQQPQDQGSVCSRGNSLTDVQRLLSARLSDSNRWTSVRNQVSCLYQEHENLHQTLSQMFWAIIAAVKVMHMYVGLNGFTRTLIPRQGFIHLSMRTIPSPRLHETEMQHLRF